MTPRDKQLVRLIVKSDGRTFQEIAQGTMTGDCPGICTECEWIIENIEQDQEEGYCDECQKNTVKSILILAGVI